MRLRQITQIREAGPAALGWAFLDVLFGANEAGKWSDMSPGSRVYNGLIQNPEYKDKADSIADNFVDLFNSKGPNDPEVQQAYRGATGRDLSADFPEYKLDTSPIKPDMVVAPKIGDAPVADPAPKAPNTTTAPAVNKQAPSKPYDDAIMRQARKAPKISKGAPVKTPPVPKNSPPVIKPEAQTTLPKILPQIKTPKQLTDVLSKTTTMPPDQISSLTSKIFKYGIPAAGVLALLYGGKKLYDYFSKKEKESMGEAATPGATSSANVSVGAVYKNDAKRDKNGVPKAKQKLNKDGTAANALDMKNNLMTGGSIKR